jgi:hypothetical protein
MRKLAHVINLFDGPLSSSAFVAQAASAESMRQARDFAGAEVEVQLLSVRRSGDEVPLPAGFRWLPELERTLDELGTFRVRRPLPLLADILDRLDEAAPDADFFVYSNADIGVQPSFYVALDDLIDAGYDAFSITRRTLPAAFATLVDLPRSLAAVGTGHPGLDCFVFRRSAYPRFVLGQIALGARRVGLSLAVNMACTAERFEILHERHLTFHWGNDTVWRDETLSDYEQHNTRELAGTVQHFSGNPRMLAHPQVSRWLARAGLGPAPEGEAGIRRLLRNAKRYLTLRRRAARRDRKRRSNLPEKNIGAGNLERLRPSDVFLVSFPKSGNTWLRFVVARLLGHEDEITFRNIDRLVPSIYTSGEWINTMEGLRVIKTHDPLFHLAPKTLYVMRDARDVMVSFFHYRTERLKLEMSFSEFLRSRWTLSPVAHAGPGPSWTQHVRSALRFQRHFPDRLLLVRYEELLAEPLREASRVADFCGIPADERTLADAVEKSSFGRLQQIERTHGPESLDHPDVTMVRSGKAGGWREYFSEADLDYFMAQAGPLLRELGYPDD